MDSVVRVVVMYAFLLLVFRISGKRTMSEATTFDLLLLLVIAETTQQAMVDDDHSITHAFLLIVTFVAVDVGLSLLKQRSRAVDRVLDSAPLVIVEGGRPLKDRMDRERVDLEDVMESARRTHGLARVEQIAYAVLERSGKINVVPAEGAARPPGAEGDAMWAARRG
jgi:uncharacterized membrane protein YcaP (DUF421 family)